MHSLLLAARMGHVRFHGANSSLDPYRKVAMKLRMYRNNSRIAYNRIVQLTKSTYVLRKTAALRTFLLHLKDPNAAAEKHTVPNALLNG